jgi:hypothetical protein
MQTRAVFPVQVELSTAHPRSLVSIENHKDNVIIRAGRDDFSSREKAFLVRYLADEGFIPERYHWLTDPDSEWSPRLTWIADRSKSPVGASRGKALRQVLLVIGCASLIWLALMILAFLHVAR